MRKGILLLILMATAVLLATGIALAQASPQLDQENNPEFFDYSVLVGSKATYGQVFTAGVSGKIGEVSLPIWREEVLPGQDAVTDLIVEIKAVDSNGLPTGDPLWTNTVPSADIAFVPLGSTPPSEWEDISFDASPVDAEIEAGKQYVILARSAKPSASFTCREAMIGVECPGSWYRIQGTYHNTYSNGYLVGGDTREPSGWFKYDGSRGIEDQDHDLGFKTYVTSTTTPTDSTPPEPPTGLDLVDDSDSGDSNTDNITNANRPTFKGKAEADSEVKIFNDGSPLGTVKADQGDADTDNNREWSYTVPSTDPALTDGEHIITATATDASNNHSGTSSDLTVTVDTEAPVLTDLGTTNFKSNGWYKTDVENSFQAEDALSGLSNATPQLPIKKTTSGEGKGLKVSSGSVSDVAGNTNSGIDSAAFDVDKTPPTLNPSVSPNPVLLNETATATAGATDTLSGIDSSKCEAVDTSIAGSKSVSCSATDKAGNTDTKSVSYTVAAPSCTFSEILPPVNNVDRASDTDHLSAYKYGSTGTIPIKFQATCDNNLVDTQAEADAHPTKLTLSKLSSGTDQGTPVEPTSTDSATTGDAFRFIGAPDNHYKYNLKVKGLDKGIYRITISDANGSRHDEWFMIK